MKRNPSCAVLFAACFSLGVVSVSTAALNISSGYSASAYHTHDSDDSIGSFDWTSNGDLYYSTSSNYTFGGIYRSSGGSISEIAAGSGSFYSGASVVAIGDRVYYNNSDAANNQFIYKYDPTVGGAPTQISSAINYSLHASGGGLFITGGVWPDPNHIFYSGIDSSGNLVTPTVDLGATSGSSGPLAFDAAGNLYYAPGFDDASIYRWSSAEVLGAIAGTPLSITDHKWMDYSLAYAGATSMVIGADGQLLVTLTSLSSSSLFVAFGIDENGDYSGETTTILESDGRLGEVRLHEGEIYIADENNIYRVIPEPSAFLILGLSGFLFTARRRRCA